MGYTIAVSSMLLVYSMAFFQGAGPDGIIVFMGTTPLLRKISWQEVTSLESTPIKNTHTSSLKLKRTVMSINKDMLNQIGKFYGMS